MRRNREITFKTPAPYLLTNVNSAPYALLAYAFSLIEGTTKRIEKTCYLTSLLHTIISRSRAGADADAGTLLQTVYLCINRLSPDYEGIELGIGESLLIKAIGESTGRKPQSVKEDLKKEGDLGLVAMVGPLLQKDPDDDGVEELCQNSKARQQTLGLVKAKPLTVAFVFSQLKVIATTTGHQVCSQYSTTYSFPDVACSLKPGRLASSPNYLRLVKQVSAAKRLLRLNLSFGHSKASSESDLPNGLSYSHWHMLWS